MTGIEYFESSQQPGPSTESDINHRQYKVTYSQSYRQTMRKIEQLGLILWCGENCGKARFPQSFLIRILGQITTFYATK